MVLIFTTARNKKTAHGIGKVLLKERLIACYNLFSVESAYWWDEKIVDDREILMILKTKSISFSKIEAYIKKYSGYEVPEIVLVQAQKVNLPYLNWLKNETK